jgi:polar amino acid transport system substrate-binding protein
VDFSVGYYDDQQALIAIKGTPIADATTIAELKGYVFGVQTGTTSLSFITQQIQPDQQPAVYDTTNEAKNALANGQIDGMVLDLPTASYTQYFIDGGTLVGKFPNNGEQFGLAFEKGNPLVTCVNPIIDEMRSAGTLDDLANRWLQNYLGVPLIQ